MRRDLSPTLSGREQARLLAGVEENPRLFMDQVCTDIQTVFCSQRRLKGAFNKGQSEDNQISWPMQMSPAKLTSEEGDKEHPEKDVEWMLHECQED